MDCPIIADLAIRAQSFTGLLGLKVTTDRLDHDLAAWLTEMANEGLVEIADGAEDD